MSRNKKRRSGPARVPSSLPGKLEQVGVVTEDMKLPVGSAVIQCILTDNDFSVRSVLIGHTEVDPMNAAHRFVAEVFSLSPQIMQKINGGAPVTMPSVEDIDRQIMGDSSAIRAMNELANKRAKSTDDLRKLDAMRGPAGAAMSPLAGIVSPPFEDDPDPEGTEYLQDPHMGDVVTPDDAAMSPPLEGITGTIDLKLNDAQMVEAGAAMQQNAAQDASDAAQGQQNSTQQERDSKIPEQQAVFSRPECIFNYCPHPEVCQESCLQQSTVRELEKPAEGEGG